MEIVRPARRLLVSVSLAAALLTGASKELIGTCGPFTDVALDAFCPFVLEIFYLGITTGTTATTYDPAANVTRLQMAAFLSRTVDGVLKRGSRRAALDQYWTTKEATNLGLTTVGSSPDLVKSDGADLWVALSANSVSRVRASDGKLLETWTGAAGAGGVLPAMGKIFVTGQGNPSKLYRIDPDQPAGGVTTLASNLGPLAYGIAYDGSHIFTANYVLPGSVSIVTPAVTIPWTVTTVTAGFNGPFGALYDGANVWVTNGNGSTIVKLDGSGAVLQTVTVGSGPALAVFDGSSVWVPNSNDNSVSIVRASTGAVLATLTGNGLNQPFVMAFDGQRVLATNYPGGSVSLWKAADLSVIGSFSTGIGTEPAGACSDGIHFWISLHGTGRLARF